MTWTFKQEMQCAGFNQGTWEVNYTIPSGVSKASGKNFNGTSRRSFIPDCPEGREVLFLLAKAFERKLTFIVGTSVTSG